MYLLARILGLHLYLNRITVLVNSPITFGIVVAFTFIGSGVGSPYGFIPIGGWLLLFVGVRVVAIAIRGIRAVSVGERRFLVFRPFSPDNAPLVRRTIVPTLSCYGRVVLIADRSFKQSSPYWQDRWFVPLERGGVEPDEFADLDALPDPSEDWKDFISRELGQATASVLVLDTDHVGKNLAWEVAHALSRLGKQRTICITTSARALESAERLGIQKHDTVPMHELSEVPKELHTAIRHALDTV